VLGGGGGGAFYHSWVGGGVDTYRGISLWGFFFLFGILFAKQKKKGFHTGVLGGGWGWEWLGVPLGFLSLFFFSVPMVAYSWGEPGTYQNFIKRGQYPKKNTTPSVFFFQMGG